MTVDRNQLVNFIDMIGLDKNVKVEALAGIAPDAPPPPVRARGPRGSKVNDAIVEALQVGQQSTKDLKKVLTSRGLAAGSLSTGLAILQRQGQVARVGEGLYELRLAKAAE